jgi:deazaflavin-dependent oxidoreductase (nitroreductase family)
MTDAERFDPGLGEHDYCYLTTTGRVTGNPHEVEIWFALSGGRIYILAGGRYRSDWVRNARKQPAVRVRIARQTFDGSARIVEDAGEDALARRLLLEKYAKSDSDLEEWGRTALPVAIELRPRDMP